MLSLYRGRFVLCPCSLVNVIVGPMLTSTLYASNKIDPACMGVSASTIHWVGSGVPFGQTLRLLWLVRPSEFAVTR